MSSPAQIDWSEIRRLYVESAEPVAVIAERHRIDPRRIYARARADGWPRRAADRAQKRKSAPRRAAAPAPRAAPASGSSSSPAPSPSAKPTSKPHRPHSRAAGTLAARRTLVRRLYRAIDTKLQQMEARMAEDIASGAARSDATAADHERDTRAIGTLIANLSRITEMEADLERARNPAVGAAERQLADEAERFRRDVAERLARLVRQA